MNPKYPYIIRVEYKIDGLFHNFDTGVDLLGTVTAGMSGDDIQVRTKSLAAEINVQEAADDVWGCARVILPATALASQWVLWRTHAETEELDIISAGPLTTPNGASPEPYVPAQQATWTFRSGGGGIKKMIVQECVIDDNVHIPIPPTDAFYTYATSGISVLMGRDRGFPIMPLNLSAGQNEAVFKARFRK